MSCCPSGFSYGAPVCVALSTGEPVQYKTKINSDQSITYVDSAGVESSSLPVGSSVINCSQISWVANQPASDGQELPIGVDCDNAPAMKTFDPCAIEILRKIEAGLQSAPSDTALLEGITRIEALLQTIAANTVPVVKNIVQLSTVIQSLDNGISDFVDVTMALDSTKEYSLNVIGYELFPLVQTSVNRQDSTTVRVVVENQSGNVIPATTILITATSLN